MKKSTNMSTKRIMSTRKPKYIRPSTWANTGATDEIQAREYWLPKLVFAGSNPVTRSKGFCRSRVISVACLLSLEKTKSGLLVQI